MVLQELRELSKRQFEASLVYIGFTHARIVLYDFASAWRTNAARASEQCCGGSTPTRDNSGPTGRGID
jgi:hypothetical protein